MDNLITMETKYTYTQLSDKRRALGPIPKGTHSKHDGVHPYTGNVIGARGYYSTCVRGWTRRVDCPPQFYKPEWYNDGHCTKYDLGNCPAYVPERIKRRVAAIMEKRNDSTTLCLFVVRHWNQEKRAIYCGAILYDESSNSVVFRDCPQNRHENLLAEYQARVCPAMS